MNKDSATPDVSVIITAHGEGRLAHRSVQSARRAVAVARQQGIAVELIAVLDAACADTFCYFTAHANLFDELHSVDFCDPGLARNFGARQAAGRYLAFLDADDLFGENWLAAAFQFASAHSSNSSSSSSSSSNGSDDAQQALLLVLHPELSLYFGHDPHLFPHIDALHPDYTPLNLIEYNYWTALCFVPREFFLNGNQYQPTDLKSGFGYEDWHWNCEVITNGALHRTVPQTVHFVRLKRSGSQRKLTQAMPMVFRPTKLFGEAWAEKLTQKSFASAEATPPPPPYVNVQPRQPHESEESPIVEASAQRGDAAAEIGASDSVQSETINEAINPIPIDRRRGGQALYRRWRRIVGSILRGHPALSMLASELDHALTRVSREAPPAWLLGEWQAISAIEPELLPERAIYRNLVRRPIARSSIATYYLELNALIGAAPTHIYLLSASDSASHLREATRLIAATAEASFDHRIVCLITENTFVKLNVQLSAGIKVVDLGRRLARFSNEDQVLLLARLLLQKNSRVIHNLGSPLGYKLFAENGLALKTQSQLYASVFGLGGRADDNDNNRSAASRAEWWLLAECIDRLEQVFASDAEVVAGLCSTYAFDKDKFTILSGESALTATLNCVPGYFAAPARCDSDQAHCSSAPQSPSKVEFAVHADHADKTSARRFTRNI